MGLLTKFIVNILPLFYLTSSKHKYSTVARFYGNLISGS